MSNHLLRGNCAVLTASTYHFSCQFSYCRVCIHEVFLSSRAIRSGGLDCLPSFNFKYSTGGLEIRCVMTKVYQFKCIFIRKSRAREICLIVMVAPPKPWSTCLLMWGTTPRDVITCSSKTIGAENKLVKLFGVTYVRPKSGQIRFCSKTNSSCME